MSFFKEISPKYHKNGQLFHDEGNTLLPTQINVNMGTLPHTPGYETGLPTSQSVWIDMGIIHLGA